MRYATIFTTLAAICVTSACDIAAARNVEVLPGHRRPVLQHDWPHPRELRLNASAFTPPDAAASLATLPNGVRAFIMPDPADNIVQVAMALPLGALRERTDEAGASNRVADAIVQRVQSSLPDAVLNRVSTERTNSALRIAVVTMPADWRTALNALASAVTQPFDVAPLTTATRGGGPGGRGGGGGGGGAVGELQRATTVPASAAPARADAVRTLAARSVTPHAVVFAVAGAIARADAENALRELTSAWSAPRTAVEPARAAVALARRQNNDVMVLNDQPSTQASLAIGHPLRAIDADDEAAVAALAEVLNVRLNIATREMRGLTNRASIDMPRTRHDAGMLVVRASSRPESVGPVLSLALDELLRIRTPAGAPTADELEQVKGGLTLGSWQAALDGARAASATYALELVRSGSLERLQRWPEAVRAVTAAQVTDAARKYIEPDIMTAAVSGQLELIRRSAHPRWPVSLDDVRARLRTQ